MGHLVVAVGDVGAVLVLLVLGVQLGGRTPDGRN